MSLARAFTTRRQKQPSVDMGYTPQRSNTVARGSGPGSIRNKISAPMALTHTTNMLAYNAPDLYPQSAASTDSSRSDSDSDSGTNASSPPTSPDIASSGRSESPEPNHLSCYFTAPGQKLPASVTTPAPTIPKRSPSHTKKASYDHYNSTRFSNQSSNSVSTKGSSSLSRSASISTTATSLSIGAASLKSPVPSLPPMSSLPAIPASRSSASNRKTAERSEAMHPFGQELAQVSEIAEEFGIRDKIQIIDEEEEELRAKGLCKFRPEEYLTEIQSLFSTFFQPEPEKVQQPVWI